MSPAKPRLDELLVERGFFASAGEAARACLAGCVRSGDRVLSQPGQRLSSDLPLSVTQPRLFVSRGGDKLAGALADFEYQVKGRRCLDVGASTGGFSDCLLKSGAVQVVAVDVGYGQFDYQLRQDPRVVLRERCNISKLHPADVDAPFNLIVADVSFSPLARLLPILASFGSDVTGGGVTGGGVTGGVVTGGGVTGGRKKCHVQHDTFYVPLSHLPLSHLPLSHGTDEPSRCPLFSPLSAPSDLIALCKPQFELPRSQVGSGVVRERAAHIQALQSVIVAAANTPWGIQALAGSRLRGAKGNIEFFFWATYGAIPATIDVNAVVDEAHRRFAL